MITVMRAYLKKKPVRLMVCASFRCFSTCVLDIPCVINYYALMFHYMRSHSFINMRAQNTGINVRAYVYMMFAYARTTFPVCAHVIIVFDARI